MFGFLKSSQSQLGASCAIAFLQNIMYGVIYAYTPSVFETSVRGSAMGIASALNRIFGCISPLIGGALLSLSFRFPLYASSLCFVICAGFMFSLPPRNTS